MRNIHLLLCFSLGALAGGQASRTLAAAEGGEPPPVKAESSPGAPASGADAQPGKKAPAQDEDAPHETQYVFLLVNGQRLLAAKYVDFGDAYSLKDEQGQFQSLKKENVRKILEPLQPPPKPEPAKPTPPTASPEAPQEKKKEAPKPKSKPGPEPGMTVAPPPISDSLPPASQTGKSGPPATFVLKNGRKVKAFQYFEEGEFFVLQSTGGYAVKVKKSDVAKIEE